MRKFILITISVFFISVLNGQDFKGGINLALVGSQVAGDCCSGYHKAGIKVGGYVSYPINRDAMISMELNYVQKGSRQTPTEDNDFQSYKLNLHYAELPFLFQYRIIEQLTAEGGLAYGYFIGKKEEANFQDAVAGKPFNRHNLNFLIGFYYNVTERFRLNLRSNNSILPIRPHTSGATRLFNQGQYSDAICLGVQFEL